MLKKLVAGLIFFVNIYHANSNRLLYVICVFNHIMYNNNHVSVAYATQNTIID